MTFNADLATRSVPPLSPSDTFWYVEGTRESVYGQIEIFSNQEILQVHEITSRTSLGTCSGWQAEDLKEIYVEYSVHKKAIIQQQAMRGCSAAAAAMLIIDHKGQCNLDTLQGRNLGVTVNVCLDITAAGLTPLVSRVSDVNDLKNQLEKNGSAIISLSDPVTGSHFVVLDYLDETTARLREPFHGWEITVTRQSIEMRWRHLEIIQIETKASAQDSASAPRPALEQKV